MLPAIGAGAIAVVAFGIGWMAGVMAAVAAAFDIDVAGRVAEASRWLLPSDGLWRGVVYGLEPPLAALVAVGRGQRALEANPFYAIDPPPLPFLAWSVAWIASSWRSPLAAVPPGPLSATSAAGSGSSPATWSSTRPTLCMNA